VNTTFQIGGIVIAGKYAMLETAAILRLAVELVNDKSDGFFDDLAPQVFLELTEDQWVCSKEGGMTGMEQMDFRVQNKTGASETVLASIIGPDCSSARYFDAHYIFLWHSFMLTSLFFVQRWGGCLC
jgi:hypothetical protein